MRLLDLFCGRFGWSRAFAARGWKCVGVDLQYPNEVFSRCEFVKIDVLEIKQIRGFLLGLGDTSPGESLHYAPTPHADYWLGQSFDFIVASPPCEQFSVHGMKNFHPNPKHPAMGIRLFNHTRDICEASGVPYVMENVRAAQQFVGPAKHHCGPFYLWGAGVPPLMPQGILKGRRLGISGYRAQTGTKNLKEAASRIATIPPELANCVADYAEALLRAKVMT